MKDETFAFISDVKEKKVTARSARHTRTHCGKGGRVRLPSDNLSKKELMKMSGECKSFRLNDPMTREELLFMPDDLKVVYIQAIRNKYGIPDSSLGKAMGFSQQRFAKLVNRLGLARGKAAGGHVKWDKEGFYAWWHGVDKLPTPVPEEPTEAPVIEEDPIEAPEVFVEDDLSFDEFMDEHTLEIKFLKSQIDELRKVNEALMANHENDHQVIEKLRFMCSDYEEKAKILEAQMEVVRMIFGGKNNG